MDDKARTIIRWGNSQGVDYPAADVSQVQADVGQGQFRTANLNRSLRESRRQRGLDGGTPRQPSDNQVNGLLAVDLESGATIPVTSETVLSPNGGYVLQLDVAGDVAEVVWSIEGESSVNEDEPWQWPEDGSSAMLTVGRHALRAAVTFDDDEIIRSVFILTVSEAVGRPTS